MIPEKLRKKFLLKLDRAMRQIKLITTKFQAKNLWIQLDELQIQGYEYLKRAQTIVKLFVHNWTWATKQARYYRQQLDSLLGSVYIQFRIPLRNVMTATKGTIRLLLETIEN